MNPLFDIQNYFLNPYAMAYFFSGILVSAEGFFVYAQNKRSLINISFAAVTTCAGIWLTGVGFMFSSKYANMALSWSNYYSWFGIILITPCLYLFSLVWAKKPAAQKRAFLTFNFLTALAIYAVCAATPYIIKEMWSYPWGYYPRAGAGHGLFLVWFAIEVFLIFRNFWHGYTQETLEERKIQTKFIIIAFIFGVFVGALDFLSNYGLPLHNIGSVGIVIFSSIIAYSIVNYRLMDIETVLHKTLLWILSFAIISIPILALYRLAFPAMVGSPMAQTCFGLASFIIFAVYLRVIQPKIDHIFQRRQADMEEITSRFTGDLVHLKGLNNLVKYIEDTIADTLYPQWVDIFIYNERKKQYLLANRSQEEAWALGSGRQDEFLVWFKEHNRIVYGAFVEIDPVFAEVKDAADDYFKNTKTTLAVPLILNEQLLGIINLGKKANLSRYNALDLHFLDVLRNQSAIAISNSLIYQSIEEQVTQRTEELVAVQRQLVQAEKLATVGTLSGGVAHEINNPLTAILTNVQMLLAFADDDGAKMDKEALELIEEATQRCRTIVQKLMAYAKKPMESGEVSRIDLADVLEKVIAFLGYQLEQDNVSILSYVEAGEYPLRGNHNELEQVMTNILLNARDAIVHTPQKKGQIRVTLAKAKHHYRLEIKDDGPGITPENMPKIFDPFFTTKDVGKGLGLGLSICQSIIDKHNGRITASSKPGQGAVFTIELPAFSEAQEPSLAIPRKNGRVSLNKGEQ